MTLRHQVAAVLGRLRDHLACSTSSTSDGVDLLASCEWLTDAIEEEPPPDDLDAQLARLTARLCGHPLPLIRDLAEELAELLPEES